MFLFCLVFLKFCIANISAILDVMRSNSVNFETENCLNDICPYYVVNTTNGFGFASILQIHKLYGSIIKAHNFTKILEVGPGDAAFPYATHVIDHQLEHWNISGIYAWDLDMDTDRIPVEDGYFDFVYCRHVLEDLNNPLHAYNEITRVARNGYIETPSPIVEIMRLGNYNDPALSYGNLRGYHHHRFILWTNADTNSLYAVAKYPIVDLYDEDKPHYIMRSSAMEAVFVELLGYYTAIWNNYYTWNEIELHYVHPHNGSVHIIAPSMRAPMKILQPHVDYDFDDLSSSGGYAQLIREGVCESMKHTINYFTDCVNYAFAKS